MAQTGKFLGGVVGGDGPPGVFVLQLGSMLPNAWQYLARPAVQLFDVHHSANLAEFHAFKYKVITPLTFVSK